MCLFAHNESGAKISSFKLFASMAHVDTDHFFVEAHRACAAQLLLLLPTLITQPDAVAATWGGSLSPAKTVLCLHELHARMHKLGLDGLQHLPCRGDVGVGVFSIASKMTLSGNTGLRGADAWCIALQQQSHVWALHMHTARDAGPPGPLEDLQVEMRAGWLSSVEASLLETLGRGLWDVERSGAVGGVLRCVGEHMDIAACADEHGMVTPQTVHMYFASSTGAVLMAAHKFLLQHIGEWRHMELLAHTCLNMLDIFAESYYESISKPVHMHELSGLHAQVQALVHAVVLACEYVLLCGAASAKLGLGG